MEEIAKAIDMAIMQSEKYLLEIYSANELFQAAIANGIKRPVLNHVQNDSNEYMPDIEMLQLSFSNAIMENGNCDSDAKPVDPMVTSDLKKLYGKEALCFGESDDALSLMEDNEQLRVTYVLFIT